MSRIHDQHPADERVSTTAERRTRWSLARRLSLLFLVVLLLVVTTFGAVAYQSVRDSAMERASERLVSTARELAAAATRSSTPRNAALSELARNPVLQSALRNPPRRDTSAGSGDAAGRTVVTHAASAAENAEEQALRRVFMDSSRATDSTLIGWELWSATGARRYGTTSLSARDSAMLTATAATAVTKDSVSRSPVYGVGQQVHLWTAVPVREGGRIVGVLAERRRMGASAQTEALLARLTGQDARVYVANGSGDEWASMLGRPLTAVVSSRALDSTTDSTTARVHDARGQALYIASAPVRGTPWRIVMTQTESAILERPAGLLRRLMLAGLLLLVLGTFSAWWLTHRETRPLGTLREATDAMAQGDYSQIVPADGAEETAALADAFNSMSMRISGVHATLAQQNAQLQQANEAKARFLAVMSHELRTPLNAIGGYADLMTLGVQGPTTEAQLESLARIRRSKDQLLHLVGDILHYTRMEATPLTVLHEPVSLHDQFASLRETMSEQFARKRVALACDDTTAKVSGDPARVQQVLLNLATNALQFTNADGCVTITAETKGDWTTVHVRDTGVGIAPEQQAAIFEPFVQADNSLTRRVGGTGLGLAIVRQLTTAMGGEVKVESVVGIGSTFSVTLPTAIHSER